MTVIAWDTKILATDSRATQGTFVLSNNVNKLFEVEHPQLGKLIGACAGAIALLGPWADSIAANGFVPLSLPIVEKYEDFVLMALFIDEEGNCVYADTHGLWYDIEHPIALGSGDVVAMHFLQKGIDAVTSVAEAITTDSGCGGEIRYYDSETKECYVLTPSEGS